MKNKAHGRFIRACAVILACSLLLAGCGTSQKDRTEEGWKPEAPVNLIVPYAAGGGLDLMARTIAQYIDLDGQTMYITNIEGGSNTIGGMEAYHADNDGLTLLMYNILAGVCDYISGALPVNLCEEMTWVACLAVDPFVFAVAADSPYESLEELIAAAKEAPGSITLAAVGSAGVRSAALQLQHTTGAEFTFVPYDSASKARGAVLGGHEDLLFAQLPDMRTYADSGELRILAVELEERTKLAPDIPTFKELGYDGLFYTSSRSLVLPPETDEEIARYYDAKIKEVFENEEFQSVMRDTLGYNMVFTGMDGMGDKIKEAIEWAEEYVPLGME